MHGSFWRWLAPLLFQQNSAQRGTSAPLALSALPPAFICWLHIWLAITTFREESKNFSSELCSTDLPNLANSQFDFYKDCYVYLWVSPFNPGLPISKNTSVLFWRILRSINGNFKIAKRASGSTDKETFHSDGWEISCPASLLLTYCLKDDPPLVFPVTSNWYDWLLKGGGGQDT